LDEHHAMPFGGVCAVHLDLVSFHHFIPPLIQLWSL